MQAQRIAQAVKERMDGVLLSVSDARAVTPAIDDAVAHGVPVMTFDSDAPDSRRFTYCGVDDVKAGETLMEELARLVPRGAHVAVLAGNRAAPNLSRRVEGVLREAARHPDIKVVGTFYTVETPEEASATVLQSAPRTRTSRAGRWWAAGRCTRKRCSMICSRTPGAGAGP